MIFDVPSMPPTMYRCFILRNPLKITWDIKLYSPVLVTFLVTGTGTRHPHSKWEEAYFGSHFHLLVSCPKAGRAWWKGLLRKNAAHIKLVSEQREMGDAREGDTVCPSRSWPQWPTSNEVTTPKTKSAVLSRNLVTSREPHLGTQEALGRHARPRPQHFYFTHLVYTH